MLGNWINLHDLSDLARALIGRDMEQLRTYWPSSSRARTLASWRHVESAPTNWWSIPEVRKRWNRLVTGNEDVDPPTHFTATYLKGSGSFTALSLACGTGSRELRWAKEGGFSRIDAIDLSPSRIEFARNAAKLANLDHIVRFQVGDVWKLECRELYDVVLAEQSLHHLAPIPRILSIVHRCLRPGGFLFVNEYVGPDRF